MSRRVASLPLTKSLVMTDEPFRIQITHRAQKDIGTLTPKLKKKLRDILINRIAISPFDGKNLARKEAGVDVGAG